MSNKAPVKTQAKTPVAPAAAHIPRPPVAELEHEVERPHIATQLEGAARLGHSLGAISVRSAAPSRIQARPLIQRQELPEEDEEELQRTREPAAIQRQELAEEHEEVVQGKPETAALPRQESNAELMVRPYIPRVGLQGGPVAPDVDAAIQRATGSAASEVRHENRTGLPDKLKAGLEHLSGLALDDVRVHYNSPRPAQVHALAYTQGTEIHVASGQEPHLPHEAWHVVQQVQGRVKPTMQAKGVGINDDGGLEREADLMAGRALQANVDLSGGGEKGTDNTNGVVHQKAANLPLQAKFGGPLKHTTYSDMRRRLVKLYVAVPPEWKIKLLADEEQEYTDLRQVATRLNLTPLGGQEKEVSEVEAKEEPRKGKVAPLPAPKPAVAPKADRLFRVDRKGVCWFEAKAMGGTEEEDLTRMYTPEGEEIFVNKENMVLGGAAFGGDYGWTFHPPRQKRKLFGAASAASLSQGLSQMFTCWQCHEQADAAAECDWVVHDRAAGGCGAANIIAGGDSHSHHNQEFRSAMEGLGNNATLSQIKATLAAHPKAAAFWGFDKLEDILRTPGAWAEVVKGAVYVHDDLKGFAASVGKLAPK